MIANGPPNRKRFSLRTLFVLMTLCCVLVGTWSVYVNPFRRQQQSLATINRLTGNVAKTSADGAAWERWLVTTFLGEDAYVHVSQVDLSGRQATDEDMRSLSGLTHVEILKLDYTPITDDGVAAVLRAMPALNEISLRYTNITDKTAAHLAAYPQVQTVVLTGTKITDAAVDDLAKHAGVDRLRTALPNCAVHFHALQESDSGNN